MMHSQILDSGKNIPFSLDDLHKMEKAVATYARLGGTNMDTPRRKWRRKPANRSKCGGYYDGNGDLATMDQIKAASKKLDVTVPAIIRRIQYQGLTVQEALTRPNPNKRL